MTLAALLFVVGAAPVISPNPFTPDATYSYQSIAVGVVNAGTSIQQGKLNAPPQPLSVIPPLDAEVWGSALLIDAMSEAANDPDEYDLISGCNGDCPVPAAGSITDWTTPVRVRIGIQVENFQRYSSAPGSDRIYVALNHLKASLQTLRAGFLRDFGLDMQVQHVHFRENEFTAYDSAHDSETIAVWEQQLTMFRRPDMIIRLRRYPGGHASLIPMHVAKANGQMVVSTAGYWFDLDHFADDPMNQRSDVLATVAMELIHSIGHAQHTECYEVAPGEPIEKCMEGAPCWAGQSVCPADRLTSYMGYCNCRWDGTTPFPYPDLVIGPRGGPMARVIRNNLLAELPWLDAPTTTIPSGIMTMADPDHDRFPTAFDNCPTVANNDQMDWDNDTGQAGPAWMRGGDACDACAITSGRHSAVWPLLFPLAILILRKRR